MMSFDEIRIATSLSEENLRKQLKKLVARQQVFRETGKTEDYLSIGQLNVVLNAVERILAPYHKTYPGRAGLSEIELVGALEQRFEAALVRRALKAGVHGKRLAGEGVYHLPDFQQSLSARDGTAFIELEKQYRESALTPPTLKEAQQLSGLDGKIFKELMMHFREGNKLVPVAEGLLFYHESIDALIEKLQIVFAEKESLTVPEFKEITGTTRKHAIPLLAWLDKKGYTRREGDLRMKGDLF